MNAIRAIARELLGLVVDDVGFAAATLGWIAFVWVFATMAPQPVPWMAILLFCGVAAILVESVLRRSGAAR
ncbi:hypothetical protein SAMN02799622_01782 [Methylobacterium sp. UNC378MF]|uniref:Uncharacterized protein n=1 Tax=Methylobacterium oryzae TaxID=334852 RepID=A0ABU7TLE0_9HYPH|nr:hypothetical protein [Methylobacterium sp. UNC378MF]SDA17299.1 hypothetical protein SAMN02799622_01782 [Methylobacterium sp. UNC378MF]